MRAIRLKTEHLTAPMGVDFTAPQLFWNCEGGVRQTAWQILAADDGGNPAERQKVLPCAQNGAEAPS